MQQMDKKELLSYINVYGFAVDDTVLYLDTHLDCKEALNYYEMVSRKYQEAVAMYETTYGPLRASGVECNNEWTWIRDPWPWEGVC